MLVENKFGGREGGGQQLEPQPQTPPQETGKISFASQKSAAEFWKQGQKTLDRELAAANAPKEPKKIGFTEKSPDEFWKGIKTVPKKPKKKIDFFQKPEAPNEKKIDITQVKPDTVRMVRTSAPKEIAVEEPLAPAAERQEKRGEGPEISKDETLQLLDSEAATTISTIANLEQRMRERGLKVDAHPSSFKTILSDARYMTAHPEKFKSGDVMEMYRIIRDNLGERITYLRRQLEQAEKKTKPPKAEIKSKIESAVETAPVEAKKRESLEDFEKRIENMTPQERQAEEERLFAERTVEKSKDHLAELGRRVDEKEKKTKSYASKARNLIYILAVSSSLSMGSAALIRHLHDGLTAKTAHAETLNADQVRQQREQVYNQFKSELEQTKTLENLRDLKQEYGAAINGFTHVHGVNLTVRAYEGVKHRVDKNDPDALTDGGMFSKNNDARLLVAAAETSWANVSPEKRQSLETQPSHVSGFDNATGFSDVSVSRYLQQLPDGWVNASVKEFKYHNVASDKHLGTHSRIRGTNERSVIDIYKHNNPSEVYSTIRHELGHANDWNNSPMLSNQQRIEMLHETTKLFESPGRFTNFFVDEGNVNPDPQLQKYMRVGQFWAEISAHMTAPRAEAAQFAAAHPREARLFNKWFKVITQQERVATPAER